MRVEKQELFTVIYADEGKVFRDKNNEVVLSSIAYLGKEDSPENYEEIEKLIEPDEPIEEVTDEQE